MFTKTEIKILKVFCSKIEGRFSINEVSKLLKMPYPLAHRTINNLIKNNFLIKDDKKFILLNYGKNISEIAYVESLRTKGKIKDKILNIFIEDMLNKSGLDFFIFLIFGSYVEKENPRDIDILIIIENGKKLEQTERIIENLASNFSFKLHINVISTESMYEMLSKNQINVVNETLNKHLIIYGAENYYKILKNAK